MRLLRLMAKKCNLNEPNEVKTTIAELKWKNTTKHQFVITYSQYANYLGLKWNQPKYKGEDRLPFIPMEKEIDELIASTGKTTATVLQMLKETGMRIGEAIMLKWIDIDFQSKTVNVTPEKGSNPRILPISDKLIAMLNRLPKRKDEHLYSQYTGSIRYTFEKQRRKTATKLNNPRLLKITFHTLRHWKGTMEYHNLPDMKHVQYILGHKHSNTTDIYVNLAQAIFLTNTDEWIVKVANTTEEAIKLVEANFTYVNNMGEKAIYKKRK
jgi:integrase